MVDELVWRLKPNLADPAITRMKLCNMNVQFSEARECDIWTAAVLTHFVSGTMCDMHVDE